LLDIIGVILFCINIIFYLTHIISLVCLIFIHII